MSNDLPTRSAESRRARERADSSAMIAAVLFIILAAVSVIPFFALAKSEAPLLLAVVLSPVLGIGVAYVLLAREPRASTTRGVVAIGALATVLWIAISIRAMNLVNDPSWIVAAMPAVVAVIATGAAFVAWQRRRDDEAASPR